jgi:hypothetical protein
MTTVTTPTGTIPIPPLPSEKGIPSRPEFSAIQQHLNEIDAQCDLLNERMHAGEDINYWSLYRLRTSVNDTREALKVLTFTRR